MGLETKPNEFIFKIMGDEYILRDREDNPEYMRKVVECIETAVSDVSKSNPKLIKSQILMLAALRIADDLQKIRNQYAEFEKLIEEAK